MWLKKSNSKNILDQYGGSLAVIYVHVCVCIEQTRENKIANSKAY